jgi:hypothetical protein
MRAEITAIAADNKASPTMGSWVGMPRRFVVKKSPAGAGLSEGGNAHD